MLAIILGVLFIMAGLAWGALAFGAASMASRTVTPWESIGAPALGLIPIVLGVVIIVWG